MWEQVNRALNESTTRVITAIANLLPGVVALLVALPVSALIAWILSAILRRFLRGIGFDKRLAGWGPPGLADWSPGRSPTLLVARTVAWGVMLMGFLIGVAAFDATL